MCRETLSSRIANFYAPTAPDMEAYSLEKRLTVNIFSYLLS
jgi:hypothetical protein